MTWNTTKNSYAAGEQIRVDLIMRNVWGRKIRIEEFSETVILGRVDGTADDRISVTAETATPTPKLLEPDDRIDIVIDIPASLSGRLQPGRYTAQLSVRFTTDPDEPTEREHHLDVNSGIIFQVVPL